MFDRLPELSDDPVGQVYARLFRDPRTDKLDLGIGVYRDASGQSPILNCILESQRRICARQLTKAYMSPVGNVAYCGLAERLILGDDHPALSEGRVSTVQTPGAGGALRAGAELVRAISADARIWLSDPTWDHQWLIMEHSGLSLATYPYYDDATHRVRFSDMLVALERAAPGDAILLHGCCHNPTGADLTPEQWCELAILLERKRLIPFVDLVYQGLGDGIEEDAAGTRCLASIVPEMLIASSSSKSFGVYRDRTGALSVLSNGPGALRANVDRHVSRITRSLYFMPPDWGAALVAEVLGDEALKALWRDELEKIRNRIRALRAGFAEALVKATGEADFSYIAREKGMFSLLPLDWDAIQQLGERHAIYLMPDGRINVAALTESTIDRVAAAVAAELRDSAKAGTASASAPAAAG